MQSIDLRNDAHLAAGGSRYRRIVMEETTADELSDEGESNDSRAIQYRDVDGEWHELDVEPKRTGDPELDVLWAMSFDEIMQILDDESHPLHEKAKQVSREITKPMVDAAHQALRPITESIAKSFDASRMVHTAGFPHFSRVISRYLLVSLPRR